MTLDQLGSLGEFIAARGVILSLIFVALQFRRGTKHADFAQSEARAMGTGEGDRHE